MPHANGSPITPRGRSRGSPDQARRDCPRGTCSPGPLDRRERRL